MAFSIAPSYNWGGIDGTWSTFNINIGPSSAVFQQVEVLPATSQSFVGVILSQGCNSSYGSGCNNSRGGIFNPSEDEATWSPLQASNGDVYFAPATLMPLEDLARDPGFSAEVGYDTVTLDWVVDSAHGAPLPKQVIAGWAATVPWLGILGISGRPSHILGASQSENGTLGTLQEKQNISSLYWAYTAGAYGESPPAWGSLTFGGYDAVRRDNVSLTVQIDGGINELQLGLTEIEIYDSSTTSTTPVTGLPAGGITTIIDSVVPEIWLPQAACASVADILGLTWNETLQLYAVNDTYYPTLKAADPTFTFYLAATADSSTSSILITLPYSAFDMNISYPAPGIPENITNLKYFPMKQANEGQYYLGRTFLQYAYVLHQISSEHAPNTDSIRYVTADYDNQTFTVAKALFPADQADTRVVQVGKLASKGLTAGDIAGIAVGVVAAVALVTGLAFWLWRRHKRSKASKSVDKAGGFQGPRLASFDMSTIVASSETAEMENREFYKPPVATADRADPYFKAELDATTTAGWPTGRVVQRAELDAGSVRRPDNRHGMSWGSGVSGVSGVSDDRIRSNFSETSPRLLSSGSPPPPGSPRSGHSRQDSDGSVPAVSPRTAHSRQHSDGSVPPASPRSGHARQFSADTPLGPFEMG